MARRRDSGITRAAHHVVNVEHFGAGAIAAEARPGYVVIHGAGLVELGPHIEQHPIARPDGRSDGVAGAVIGIRGGIPAKYSGFSYDLFAGTPIYNPAGFPTARVTVGVQATARF